MISTIVPTYNSANTILKTLHSLINQEIDHVMQIIIVDDGSTDETEQVVCQWIQQTTLTENWTVEYVKQAQQGEAVAINTGLNIAKGAYVAWIESDVILESSWFRLILAEFNDQEVAGVGGLLLPVTEDTAVSKIFGYEITLKMMLDREPILHITSANAMYRKSIFEQIGSCTQKLGASSFDSEFNDRIRRQTQFVLKRNTNALAYHHFKSSLIDCYKRTFWYGFRRPYVSSQVLYSFDKTIGVLVLLAAISMIFLILSPLFGGFFWGAVIILIMHLAYGWLIYSYFQYTPLLWSGIIFYFRNIIFFFSYGLGLINYWMKR